MKKIGVIAILMFSIAPCLAWGKDLLVIVNKNNPIDHLTQQQLTDLYMGRSHYFPQGGAALKIDAPGDSEVRAQFYKALVDMSLPEVNAYWARLMFSGRATPPMQVSTQGDMIQLVTQNPNAIGYIQEGDENAQVKTVFVIHLD